MNTELIVLYKQLEKMEQTKEVLQLKEQIKERIYQQLRMNFLDVIGAGRVIGYEELQQELNKAIELLEIQIKI
ncbi:MAG: hypothetical protein IPJ81_00040 [Chitinophagaceae bacterium]|nr:hypothetical protein [Chitinophagaceae bacterium]